VGCRDRLKACGRERQMLRRNGGIRAGAAKSRRRGFQKLFRILNDRTHRRQETRAVALTNHLTSPQLSASHFAVNVELAFIV